MSGSKLIINDSGVDLQVSLFIQHGRDVTSPAGSVVVPVPAGGQVHQSYGEATGSEFLNGISLSWQAEGGSTMTFTEVAQQSDTAFGNAINTHNTITITAVSASGLQFTNS